MATGKGLEFTGLRELNAYLRKIGVPDAAVKEAMNEAGQLVQQEAWRIMPTVSGNLARTLKVNKAKNKLVVSVGNNTTVQYGWTFHANSIRSGYAKGAMTFNIPAHTRQGKPVRAYSTVRRIRVFPFLFVAFERKKQDLYRAYVNSIGELIRSHSG